MINTINISNHHQTEVTFVSEKWEYRCKSNVCKVCIRDGQAKEIGESILSIGINTYKLAQMWRNKTQV